MDNESVQHLHESPDEIDRQVQKLVHSQVDRNLRSSEALAELSLLYGRMYDCFQSKSPGDRLCGFARFDEWGVPHIDAQNEADLYRALGFLHAQDRWFQMEMVRRLARGELAEILGPKLLELDRLFRTLELRHRAQAMVASTCAKPSPNTILRMLRSLGRLNSSPITNIRKTTPNSAR